MRQYLLSLYQPDGEPPAPEVLEPIMAGLASLRAEMEAAGAWVYEAGLHPSSAATVVRDRDGEAVLTDGPFTEGKEHLGGFTIIRAADLDAALAWAHRFAAVTTLPIEVRPLAFG
jgi:hypothetical protein